MDERTGFEVGPAASRQQTAQPLEPGERSRRGTFGRLKAAVVGLGYWGPNLARNFQTSEWWQLDAICDTSSDRLEQVGPAFPGAAKFTSLKALLAQRRPDLVAIATPVATHRAMATLAISEGCNVLVEKPLCTTVRDAEALCELADRVGVRLFVDHTFTATGAVRCIADTYQKGQLGDLCYVDSVRTNLGLFQSDTDVVWDLAPHDISILSFVLRTPVRTVQATGRSHNPRNMVDVAYIALGFDGGMFGHLHVSWLSPVKVRRMLFSGTRSSVIFDDVEGSEKIKIYDSGFSFESEPVDYHQLRVNYRRGDILAPAIDNREALATLVSDLARSLRGAGSLAPSGADGLQVVRVLEAASHSIRHNGRLVNLRSPQ